MSRAEQLLVIEHRLEYADNAAEDCEDAEGLMYLLRQSINDCRVLLIIIRELELETTTTRVSCDGCDIGFRPRELYLGRCAKCWAGVARDPSSILKGLDDAF